MKISNSNPRSFLQSATTRHIRWTGGFLVGVAASGLTMVDAATWIGTTNNNWNTSSNWSGTFGSAVINSIPANVPTISANISPTPVSTFVGNTAAARVNHTAGTATVSVTSGPGLILGRSVGGNGTYYLTSTVATVGSLTGYGQGSGTLTIPSQILVGGNVSASTGTLNVHTSGTVSVGTDLLVGNVGGTGTVNMENGTITVGSDFSLGNGTSCNGTFSMSGGSFSKTANGTTAVLVGGSSTAAALSGGTGTLNLSGGTFSAAGVVSIGNRPSSTGTVNITGGSFTSTGVLNVGYSPSSNGTLVVSGGTLNANIDMQVGAFTGATGNVQVSGGTINSGSWVVIGRRDGTEGVAVGGTGNVTMTGGTWNKTGDSNFIVGAHGAGTMNMSGGIVNVASSVQTDRGVTWVGEQNNCTGTLTLSGTADFRTARITMGVQTGTTGTLHLNGGTLRTAAITGGIGTANVNFNGTSIIGTANSATFIDTLDTANIASGGLLVNTAGFNLTSSQMLSGVGGIVKSGAGTLTLTAANDYTGAHQVNQGKLVLNSEYSGSGNITVADGATLGVLQNLDISLTIPAVTMGATGATSLDLDLGNGFGNPSAAPLNVTGTLALNGTVTVNVADANPEAGSFTLISYGAKTGTGQFVLGSLPSGVSATLTDDNAGTVTLEIGSISAPKWTGATDANWDTTTQNWLDMLTSNPATFSNGAPALFDDTATGPVAINLSGTVTPGDVKFENSSLVYSLSGAGKISGATGLTKNGTADLTIDTINDFTGTVQLNGGTTTISTAVLGGSGSLGSGTAPLVMGGGVLNYTGPNGGLNRSLAVNGLASQIQTASDLTITGQVTSNAGNLVKTGAGNLKFTYPGANVLGAVTSGVLVHAGTLTLDGGGTQTNNVVGEMWLADQPDTPADLVLNNTSLTTSNWLSIGRGNGDNGVTHVTATGSTVNTVNFSTGFNNGLANNASEAYITLNNTIWTNNGVTYLAESPGSMAQMTLTGSSQYNINNNLLITRDANTQASLTLSDSSSLTKTGGYTSIGTNGVGSLTVQNNATFTSTSGDFNIGDVGTSVGTMTLKDSATANVANVFIGKNTGTSGTLNQTGGTFSSASYITIGRYASSTGVVNVSGGSFSSTTNFIIGEEGSGTFTLSGTGTINVGADTLYVALNGGTGTLNLNGGTVNTRRLTEGTAGNSTVNFNGGLLKAAAGANTTFVSGLDSAVIQAGGARIDTNGQNLTIPQNFSGSGGFTKSGTGTLTLSGANTYTGPTTVNAGTLSVNSAFFANTSAITIAGGAVLNLSHALTDQVGSLTINNVSMPPGVYDSTTSPGVITGTGKLSVTGASSPYDTWMSGYPSIPLADRDPGDDPDADGLKNIAEFALNGNPSSGAATGKVVGKVASVAGAPTLVITLPVRTGATFSGATEQVSALIDGVIYHVQGSDQLGAWNLAVSEVLGADKTAIETGLPALSSGWTYRTFRSPGGIAGDPSDFLRAVIVSP